MQAPETTAGSADQSKKPSIVFYSFNDEDALAVIRMLGPAKLAGLDLIPGAKDRVVISRR